MVEKAKNDDITLEYKCRLERDDVVVTRDNDRWQVEQFVCVCVCVCVCARRNKSGRCIAFLKKHAS